MDVRKYLENNILIFDGAMGTMLQQKGLSLGELPETFNITHPETVLAVHREYVLAGADVITTNTFQACELKLKNSPYSVKEIIESGILLAKKSGAKYTALDIGPTGQLLEPLGTLKFETAYELFKEQMVIGENAGADIILIETMSDIYEMKAAILAAKENTKLPVFATLTYQQDGRTFTGTDPACAIFSIQNLGIDALGVNCSLGPKEIMPIVDTLLKYSKIPVMVQANAGLPELKEDTTFYNITSSEFAYYAENMIKGGVNIIGGCCGTTPEFIKKLRQIADSKSPAERIIKNVCAVTSSTKTVFLDNKVTVVGERINPTGKKRLKEALKTENMDFILSEALSQMEKNADVLDINTGLPDIDEITMMKKVIREVQSICNLPLQIDSADYKVLEAGLRIYNGRPIINSVNGTAENMAKVFPLAKKYGAVVIGLTLDESGIPYTAKARFDVAKRIVETAALYDIPKEDIIIDCLTLTASAQQNYVCDTLEAIKLVKSKLGVKTILGVSNVSFGLPNRPLLNSAFLLSAFGAGLDLAIVDPLSDDISRAIDIFRVFNAEDKDSRNYIETYANTTVTSNSSNPKNDTLESETSSYDLVKLLIQGRKIEAAKKTQFLLETEDALSIINKYFISSLDIVGEKFEKGIFFLPQLIQSAEAVKACFDIINDERYNPNINDSSTSLKKEKVIVATVEGDIHDIGKNIAKMLMQNYGYQVIDLGKDVPVADIVEAAIKYDVKLIGLSALMTTTVKSMKKTIAALKEAGLECRVMVGGAVLNSEYAEFVGADYYVKDARENIMIAKEIFKN